MYRSAIFLFIVFSMGCSILPDNDTARERMSLSQLAFLDSKIDLVKQNMNEEEISKILGNVYRGQGTDRPIWLGPEKNKLSQILVYYKNGKIFQIRWLALGNFSWQKRWKI